VDEELAEGNSHKAGISPGGKTSPWNKPEATAATLRDGWVYTGNIGFLESDGYLHFLGRVKEMIKCSGYSVFPEDVEVMLLNHPAVA
jgi:long-chain acyl-CoA synthetase